MLSTLRTRLGFLRPSVFQAARRSMSSTTGTGPENTPIDSTKPTNETSSSSSSTSSIDEKKVQMASIMSDATQQQKQTPAQLSKLRNSLIPSKVYENATYTRKFKAKTIYHPRDLNEMEVLKASRRIPEVDSSKDPFVALGINPLKDYKNTNLLASFVTEMGKIKPRYKTGLTAKSQRRLSKAIKRARAFGLMPVTSRPYFMYNYKSLGRNVGQY
ncbi:hypothetical protein J3B02_006519 [Coemansia erecta]|uniref:Small ribosomal subunit protein bS18m n=1 Tax=Coemansia asiatica TaxID=1052880 RepID=A0A9W7XSB6_9FUNG|nr:hypothetical protein LPJ64_000559 [Coemansia asiatica]KAJ2836077.1 hypothetical protein J3B02_006519 [Coemansia erecta]KAJ2853289.1 hypothetical protein FB639_006563 [Coemansia asiatica]